MNKTYAQIFKESAKRQKKVHQDTECRHNLWIKRCSTCGKVLESDVRISQQDYDLKIFYNDLNKIVCSYSISKRLKKHSIRQNSLLFYIRDESTHAIHLITKENAILYHERYSAFTSQELFRMLLYRISQDIITPEFLIKIGKLGDNPTGLAKLVIKYKKEK